MGMDALIFVPAAVSIACTVWTRPWRPMSVADRHIGALLAAASAGLLFAQLVT